MAALTEQDIIRIEKKLKAQVRIDDKLDTNDVAKIVHALRNDKAHIIKFYDTGCRYLRLILSEEKKLVCIPQDAKIIINFEDGFIRFINDNFQDQLSSYVDKCFKSDHYYGLYSLLRYVPILTAEFVQTIEKRLEQKMVYLIEIIQIESNEIETKTIPATNPYFYRCLNLLGAIQFEDEVSSLLNTTLSHIKNKSWSLKVLFALGMFKAVNEEMKLVLAQNKRVAYKAGVREETYFPDQYVEKGNTVIRKGGEASKSSAVGCASLIIVLLIFGVRTLIRENQNKIEFKMPDYITSFEASQLNDSAILEDVISDQRLKTEALDFTDALGFLKQMRYLHSDTVNIIAQKDIPFNNKNSNLGPKQLNNPGNTFLEIKNKTKRQLVVIAENGGVVSPLYYCLNPNQQIGVMPMINTVYIYSGEIPQMVDYVDPDGDTLSHFRFNTFTNEDSLSLERKHTVHSITADMLRQRLISITFSNGKYTVESAYN